MCKLCGCETLTPCLAESLANIIAFTILLYELEFFC